MSRPEQFLVVFSLSILLLAHSSKYVSILSSLGRPLLSVE